jgi:hypothetical protein
MLAHFGHHPQPVHLGQHAINDRHVIGARQRQAQAGFPVRRFIHHMAGFLEALHQVTLRFQIVFDYENPHLLSR